jgi:hypothetical protein
MVYIYIKINKMTIKVSVGELFDKIAILEIKRFRITDPEKLHNVLKEYNYLCKKALKLDKGYASTREFKKLYKINLILWEIENSKRSHEKSKDFGAEFIELARNVYKFNDKRALVKKAINTNYNSEIIEEKSYK